MMVNHKALFVLLFWWQQSLAENVISFYREEHYYKCWWWKTICYRSSIPLLSTSMISLWQMLKPMLPINEVKRLTLFKYPVFLVYLVRRKCANPLSLKSACPKLSMSERIEKQGYLPSKLVANIEDITNFIFSCWKYLSLSSEANEWEILSAREDKIRMPARPYNILYI